MAAGGRQREPEGALRGGPPVVRGADRRAGQEIAIPLTMDRSPIPSHPVLSAEETRAVEGRLLGGDEQKVWGAMLAAGAGVGAAALRDFGETGEFPAEGRILVLAGKGKNAGDALIAAPEILQRFPRAGGDVVFAFGTASLGPAPARAWAELSETCCGRAREVGAAALAPSYELC